VIAFYSPEDNADIDILGVRIEQLPKVLGHTKKPAAPATGAAPVTSGTPAPPPAAPAAPGVLPPASAPANGDGLKALQEQLRQQQAEKAKQDQQQQKVSSLLQQALKSTSPQEQIGLYDQILLIDPNHQVAFNARKDAQAKADAAAAQSAA